MDKVDLSSASLLNPFLHPGNKTETKKTRGRSDIGLKLKQKFSRLLEESEYVGELGPLSEMAPSEEALTELMDAVHSAGSDLTERPFHDEILKFKKAVRNFVHYVLENGYELQKIQGIKKKIIIQGKAEWKPTVYSQIQVVDQKLDELAAAILSGQADQLRRIAKIDEITGLLVDLTVTGVIREV